MKRSVKHLVWAQSKLILWLLQKQSATKINLRPDLSRCMELLEAKADTPMFKADEWWADIKQPPANDLQTPSLTEEE